MAYGLLKSEPDDWSGRSKSRRAAKARSGRSPSTTRYALYARRTIHIRPDAKDT
jgi:hypothetical protein